MNIDLSDDAQAVLGAEGPILVLGGPGSGKTTLALLKAQRLLPTLQPGQEVLFLSFSRAAVHQVLVRCRDVLNNSERQLITVKTYHAFCLDLLKSHGQLLTGWPPRIVYPTTALLAKYAHNGDWAEEEQRLAHEEGRYCFGQFAPTSVELLSRAACVLELIGKKYPIIIFDEFQDTDNAQWELVKLLSQHSWLIVLADPDQRIFEYDIKVDPKRLDHLRAFLEPIEFNLGNANHRSPDASILVFADALLRNEPLPQTDDVSVVSYWRNSFPAAVHAYVARLDKSLREEPIPSPTVAILCRTNSLVAHVSNYLNDTHRLNGNTYQPLEHHVLWDSELTTTAAEVVVSILEWPQLDLRVAVAATLDHISNYYKLKFAVQPSKEAYRAGASYCRESADIRNGRQPRSQVAKHLAKLFAAGLTLRGIPEKDWLLAWNLITRISKLQEISTYARFVRLFRATDEIGSVLGKAWLDSGSYGQAAETVRRTLDVRKLTTANTEPSGIVLMTMHKAKGREFDGVVIVERQYEGQFFDSTREPEPFEATRRLLRVAITRARHKVCIVRPKGVRALTDP